MGSHGIDLRRLRAERPPVFLLGGGLNLIRPLGFARIPVLVASPDPREPAFASRYCSGDCLLPPLENRDAMAEALLAAGDRIASAVGCRVPLFYGNDDYLELIYSLREPLSRYYLLLLNDPETGRALINKDRFIALARDRGLAVPRTLSWHGTGADALNSAASPVAVKPKVKVLRDDSRIYQRLLGDASKARIFENGRQVMDHPLAIQLKDELTFQEYIPGNDRHLWSFHGVTDEQGALLASFVGHKLRTFPVLTGMSTYLELAHNKEVAALGRDVVARVPLKGVFKIDIKQDAVTGCYYVLEINSRFNLWHHMAARNGVNLPQVAYDYLVNGKRPSEQRYRTAFRWLHFRSDLRAFRELASRGEMSLGGWLLSLIVSRKVYDLFSWSDPVPCLQVAWGRVKSRLQRWAEHIMSRLREWLSMAF